MTATRHFIDVNRLKSEVLRGIVDRAQAMKDERRGRPKGEADEDRPLAGMVLAMIFEKPSTRTRVSFDVAMRQLGGEAIVLDASSLQLGRGESIADTARVLSRYVDAIMIRTYSHANLMEVAKHSSVPVINGLTDDSHPCQLIADVMTIEEHKGPVADLVIAWSGDGNNMAQTWIQGAARFGYALRLACPKELGPARAQIEQALGEGADVTLTDDPEAAVEGADCVVTDAWVSMGHISGDRHNLLAPFQVNGRLMGRAKEDAIFMHCLPAHRGEEVTGEVMDGPQSVVFDQAENRVYAQKGILAWCFGK